MVENSTIIVIVNYKGWKDTIECLESVFKLISICGHQVFVVDNSPVGDVSFSKISDWANENLQIEDSALPHLVFPQVEKPVSFKAFSQEDFEQQLVYKENLILIRANENNGFAAANNIVINKILENKIIFQNIWLLNNDTLVDPNALIFLEESVKGEKDPVVRGSLMYDATPPFKIQSVGAKFNPKKCSTTNIVSKEYIIDNGKIDYVSGASFFVNSNFLKIAGKIPEEYFLYYEELSWIKKANCKDIKTILESIVYHKGGGSTKVDSKASMFSEYYAVRNKLAFTKANYPNYYVLVAFRVFFLAIRRFIIGEFKRGILFFKILLGVKVDVFKLNNK